MARQTQVKSAPERIHPSLAEHVGPIDDLHLYAHNARNHDLADLRAKLRKRGQIDLLVVNVGTYTGRPNEVISGNGRLEVMREDGWSQAARRFVDLDEQTLAEWVISLNPPDGRDPGHDTRSLLELLAMVDDPASVGYGDEHLAALEESLDPPPGDPLPLEGDADTEDLETMRTVVIECADEREQQDILEGCLREGWEAKAITR